MQRDWCRGIHQLRHNHHAALCVESLAQYELARPTCLVGGPSEESLQRDRTFSKMLIREYSLEGLLYQLKLRWEAALQEMDDQAAELSAAEEELAELAKDQNDTMNCFNDRCETLGS